MTSARPPAQAAGAPVDAARRAMLIASAATLSGMASCSRDDALAYSGGWVGANAERGHRFRDATSANAGPPPAPDVQRRVSVLVVGAGIAGLAAARRLMQRGIDDVHVVDLEDVPGGNSRGHRIAGMDCPLGAHYLPLPGAHSIEVIELLEAFGLRRTEAGQPVYDERYLCHSPQERLFIEGQWVEGLLPPVEALPAAQREPTLAQYRQFALLVDRAMRDGAYTIPTARSHWSPALDVLDATAFAPWLDTQGLNAPALRWYLDYCCRDDYGAGAGQVSAWAGLHYFASRHGFHAPGDAAPDRDGVLTWPEGNAWLARRLSAPLGERLHTGMVALRATERRGAVEVDLWNAAASRTERWTATQVVLALPLFVAARLLAAPPVVLVAAVAAQRHAPWLVGNLHLDQALADHPGAALSWDNVVYDPGPGVPTLGYVDAMHQSTRRVAGATVLTTYWALGGDTPDQLAKQRERLLGEPWAAWAAAVVTDVARAHPDLPAKLRQVDLMRYGHAMSIPVPGLRGSAALRALAAPQRRIQFAHTDLSSYSVFEEAMYHGTRAADAVMRAFGSRAATT